MENGKKDKPIWLEVLGIILTPLAIGGSGAWITYKMNMQQQENAKTIAEAQMENAQKISDAQIEVGKLDQIKDLFKDIFIENTDKVLQEEIVISLAAYGYEALPFVQRVLTYAEDSQKLKLKEKALESIRIILGAQLNMEKTEMKGKPLRNAQLSNYNLRRSDFTGSNLYKANLKYSYLEEVKFINADLYGATFAYTNLTDAKFKGANLKYANFENAKLNRTDFQGAENIEYTEFTPWSLQNALFEKEDIDNLIKKYNIEENNKDLFLILQIKLGRIDFKGNKILRNADFHNSNLEKIIFDSADLFKVNFSHSNLSEAHFKKANLQGANFTFADLSYAVFDESDLKDVNFEHAKLEGADFLNAKNIEYAKFTSLSITNSNFEKKDIKKQKIKEYKYYEHLLQEYNKKGHL
jgi:uncharacterized protein YjbI with pentapeptide repeats